MPAKIPSEDLLKELKAAAKEVGRSPSKSEFNEIAEVSASACRRRFGSWNEALRKAGLSENKVGDSSKQMDYSERDYDPQLSTSELIQDIHRVHDLVDGAIVRSKYDEHGNYARKTLFNRFGSWLEALKSAGIDPEDRNLTQISDSELLEDLSRLAENLGRPPCMEEMEAEGQYSTSTYESRFGSWNAALEEVGFEPRAGPIGARKENLLKEINNLADELGHTPSQIEMRKCGRYSIQSYSLKFGTWLNAIEAAGLTPKGRPQGEDHHRWKGGVRPDYGEGWNPSKRRAIRRRDKFTCQDPSCTMDQEAHIEEHGMRLHVHHIQPITQFENKRRGNQSENLISLCLPCHRKWEQMSPLRPDAAGLAIGE